jgi:iron complex outermembrane receptor protein
MLKRRYFCGGSLLAAVLVIGACGPAAAQEKGQAAAQVSEVVVTGSYIAGTPEDAALPVSVMSSELLQRQGSPSPVELIKALPEAAGIIGESNQFTAGRGQGAEGLGSINLRGLGPERTLVLLNGHRLPLAAGNIVDTNSLPMSAIGRIEVLKDGAAATYGSDAIGGVVNFITKKHVQGLEIGGDYRDVRGSGGEWTANFTYGRSGDGWDGFVSGNYWHRSALPILSRSWAHQPYDNNPEGGWSGASNPTEFTPAVRTSTGLLIPAPTTLAAPFVDVGCTALGGVLTGPNVTPSGAGASNCRTQYTIWDNLEEDQNTYTLYGEFNADAFWGSKFHAELAYANTDIPHANTTPSYATSRPVPLTVLPPGYNALVQVQGPPQQSFLYFVPNTNPGFAAYQQAHPEQLPAGLGGAFITVGNWRPYLAGGNPLFDNGESYGIRKHEQWRGSLDLKGDMPYGIGWDANLTYGRYKYYSAGFDTLTDRLELALRGLGGPNCNFQTGTPGVGPCQYYNPFSNSIAGAPRNGDVKNPGFIPSLANTAELTAWMFPFQSGTQTSQIWEGNLVFNGKLPWALPGGDIGWAAGGQWRRNQYDSEYSDFANALVNPCTDTPVTGSTTCTPHSSPAVFLGTSTPLSLEQDIYAAFVEFSLPVTDTIDLDLAARYEDYGQNGGSTFNPQARAKWQATDWLAFRGSVGTTFRAPPQGQLIPDPATSLQNVLGAFRPVDTIGNPNLAPEKATTFSVGAIVQQGPFRATVDYWNYDLKDVLTVEPLTQVVAALFPTGSGTGNCATLDPAFIASHFVFSGPCSAANVTKVVLQRINGPEIKTDGVDFNANYRLGDDIWGGSLTLGVVGSYVHKYDVGALQIGTVAVPAFSAVGFFNVGLIAYPLPQWKGQLYAEWNNGPVNVRWTVRYTDSYIDQRTSLFTFNPAYKTPTNQGGIVPAGQKIKSAALSDLAIRYLGPWDTTWTFAVNNVFDQNPPFARTELNYDALTGDPLGRTIKIGLQKKF